MKGEAHLQVLDKSFQKCDKVFGFSDVSRYCFFQDIFWKHWFEDVSRCIQLQIVLRITRVSQRHVRIGVIRFL
jgi:hypothetical protein